MSDENPALEPVPPVEPGAGTYTVTAPTRVCGFAPGETFTKLIPPDQEALLLESGALVKVEPEADPVKASTRTTKEGV